MKTITNAFHRVQDVVVQAAHNTEAAFSYRNLDYLQEVPFQRWWVDNNYDAPIAGTCDRWKARGWALLVLFEGCFRALITAIAMIYHRCCCGDSKLAAKQHEYILKQQGIGLKYTLCAIWSPNGLKEKMHSKRTEYAEAPPFGYKKGKAPWGTPYDDKLTIDFCTVNHPWKQGEPRPWE